MKAPLLVPHLLPDTIVYTSPVKIYVSLLISASHKSLYLHDYTEEDLQFQVSTVQDRLITAIIRSEVIKVFCNFIH